MNDLRWLRLNTGALSYDELFVITLSLFDAMTEKLCKEQQILFGNNMKYFDFIAGKYFCEISS